MSYKNEYIEISEKTLDDCITSACRRLSITSEKLDYEVLDQGSSGFMGFNSRNAVIKARVKENEHGAFSSGDVLDNVHEEKHAKEEDEGNNDYTISSEYNEINIDTSKYNRNYSESDFTRRKNYSSGSSGRRYNNRNRSYENISSYHHENRSEKSSRNNDKPMVHFSDEQVADVESKADVFMKSVFAAMEMEVDITYDFDKENNILNIDFEGYDMGVLIGKRGQTLDSIQYLISLIVNKDLEGYIHVKTDTENYRARRKKTLENLARNVASKVKRSHRPQALEPMNPYERRIIHSALQNDRYVTTYSEGEEPYRHVVIAPQNK